MSEYWYVAGALVWRLHQGMRARGELPIKILMHPADINRLWQKADPTMMSFDLSGKTRGQTLMGTPVVRGDDPTEHVAEIVWPHGERWELVQFESMDFEEPFPSLVVKDVAALRAAGYPR